MANTGTLYPGTAVSTAVTPYDDFTWNSPGNVLADDTNYASITDNAYDTGQQSYMLYATNFNATVPTNGTIAGVQVEIGNYYATGIARDAVVGLINGPGTPIGDNLGSLTTTWPTTAPGTAVYGGSTNLWGTTLTPAIVNGTAFGVRFAGSAAGNNCDAYVDFIRMVIFYDAPVTQWNITAAEDNQAQAADLATLGVWTPIAPSQQAQAQIADAASLSLAMVGLTAAENAQAQVSDAGSATYSGASAVYNPTTGTLDAFGRANGTLGANWGGPFQASNKKWRVSFGSAVVPYQYGTALLEATNTNNRYFVNQDGTPILLIGDAAYSAIVELTTAQMDTYLADRQSRGFKVVIANLIEHLYCTNVPNNIYDDAPFTGADFTTPNEDYFVIADAFLDKCQALGIYVLLYPLFLGTGGTDGWYNEVDAASDADLQSWGGYCGNRYKDYNNIIWVIGADIDPTGITSQLNAFVTGLQTYDTRHLITFMGPPETLGTDYIGSFSWINYNNLYCYGSVTSQIKEGYDYSPTMPCLYLEGRYENEAGSSPSDQRALVYWAMLGGHFGHVFGNNPIWKFAYDGGDWEAALDDAGSVGMQHAISLFSSVDWHTLVPDYAHSLVTSGYGTLGTDDYAGAAIDSGGTVAVIYMPTNRTMAVNMGLFAGTVTARWFDPTNGSYAADAASPLANSGSHNFSHAGTNNAGDADWALLLET